MIKQAERRHIAIYGVLMAVTAVAAAALVVPNILVGGDTVTDPQWAGQYVAEWRRRAVLAYTSGSAVGHVCALLAGLLVARWSMHRERRAGLVTALLAGSGLGAAELAVASWTATPFLRDLSGFPGTGDPLEDWVIDPSLQNHVPVLVAMASVFVVFLVAAGAGFWMAHRGMLLRSALVTAFVLVVPVALFFVTVFSLVPLPQIGHVL
ncbi:hypothetical protein ABGB14_43965 [Nonomuraea sp. B10E15]|uniref:hypothetical protein n=1 Tax=Nonomuraea sp. B10E15 TaxID=3153560 RepID=UPI00325CC5BF